MTNPLTMLQLSALAWGILAIAAGAYGLSIVFVIVFLLIAIGLQATVMLVIPGMKPEQPPAQ